MKWRQKDWPKLHVQVGKNSGEGIYVFAIGKRSILTLLLLVATSCTFAQTIIADPDGTHSIIFENGAVINPDGAHSVMLENGDAGTLLIPTAATPLSLEQR